MEKSSVELFNEAIKIRKEADKASDKIDEIKREINRIKNHKDKFLGVYNRKIRKLEEEERDWNKIKRNNNTLAEEKDRQGWQVKRGGL
jgi:Co/Zn/Cd efflux system component